LVEEVLGSERAKLLHQMQLLNGSLNMTELALRLSGFVNGVSMRHREVSRELFPGHPITRDHLDIAGVPRAVRSLYPGMAA
jgi:starch phosphorylase